MLESIWKAVARGLWSTGRCGARKWVPAYDPVDQLTGVSVRDAISDVSLREYSYEYDAAGNRTGAIIDGSATHWGANAFNQLTVTLSEATISGVVDKPSVVKLDGKVTLTDENGVLL